MEELNVMNNMEEVVETATDLTLGQNIAAYAIAGTLLVGVGTIGYFTGKGIGKLWYKVKDRKKKSVDEEPIEVNYEDCDIKPEETNQDEK